MDVDMINQPSHYTQAEIECIDYIRMTSTPEEYCGFLLGNVKKYVHRYKDKGGIEDLKKSRWYLQKAIELMQEAL